MKLKHMIAKIEEEDVLGTDIYIVNPITKNMYEWDKDHITNALLDAEASHVYNDIFCHIIVIP